MIEKVIDISKHQCSFDPSTAKNAGVQAVVFRVAYGTQTDKTALDWVPDTVANGLPAWGYGFGTWHYKSVNGGSIAAARNHMRQQVGAWVNAAHAAGIAGYLAIDQELESGQTMALDMISNTTLINEAADIIRNAGFKPLLYCSVAWDYDHIKTAALAPDLNYWFAYYPKAAREKILGAATLTDIPAGTYGNWLQRCHTNGRLAAWQYGGGYGALGAKYGCGSTHVDRNNWYIAPDVKTTGATDLHAVKTDVMSKGDLDAVKAVLNSRSIGFEVL